MEVFSDANVAVSNFPIRMPAAEVAFVSTSKWAPQVRRASATVPIRHLPVGSNIPVKKMPINEARRQCGIDPDAVVVGVFGAAHVSRLLDWIATATLRLQRDYPNTVLLYIGRDGSKVIEACQGVKVIDTGTLLSEAMSAYFCAMDFCLAPFADGLCSRRGSIIALLQHGIPVAGRSKPFVDQVFEKFSTETLLRSNADTASAFAEDVALWVRQSASLQSIDQARPVNEAASPFEWKAIAAAMIDCLKPA